MKRRQVIAALLALPAAAIAANRKGSKRQGGTNSAGKGSQYSGAGKSKTPKRK